MFATHDFSPVEAVPGDPVPARPAVVAASSPDAMPRRTVYGQERGLSWPAIGIIVAAHGALLAALLTVDVIKIAPRAAPTEVMLIPLEVGEPPPPARHASAKPTDTPPPIVAPPPIVQTAVLAPPPVQVSPTPPPPAPIVAPPTPPAEPPAVSVSPPDGNAKTLGNPPPKYPMAARMGHQEGVVRLRVLITPDGAVKEISVARSSGFDSLDNAALDAVRRWRFLPGLQAGRAVEAVGYLNIPFRLTRA